jgi:rhodanese-related sulfurtransferase
MKSQIIMLILAITILGGFQSIAQTKNIQPSEVKDLMAKGYEFIDVREVDEVKELAYGMDNVKNIPLSELDGRMGEFLKNKKYIIACKSGGRSSKACSILGAKDLNVVNMDGGIMKWQEDGLSVKPGAETTSKACCANPNSKKCNPDGTCKTKKNGKPYKQCKK